MKYTALIKHFCCIPKNDSCVKERHSFEVGAGLDTLHGIPFLLERMTNYNYSDLGIWQIFFPPKVNEVSLSFQGK